MVHLKIIFVLTLLVFSSSAYSYDDEYSLKSISLLPVIDNVGGAESKKIERDIETFLERHSRWSLKPSGQQRYTLIEEKETETIDPDLLKEFGASTGSDGLYRVIVKRLPNSVEGIVQLIMASNGKIVSSREFQISNQNEVRKKDKPSDLGPSTKLVIERVVQEIQLLESGYHFKGEISGRTGVDVTLSALSYDVKVDDILDVVRIEKVESHPLLGNVTKIETFPVGEIRVTEIGAKTGYGRILSENKSAVKVPFKLKKSSKKSSYRSVPDEYTSESSTRKTYRDSIERSPVFGRIRFSLLLGKQNRRATSSSGTKRGSYSGTPYGVLAEGELWITKKVIAQMHLGLTNSSGELDTGGSKTMTGNDFGLLVGYRFLPLGYFLGPKIDLKVGYIRQSFSTDPDATEEYGGGAFGGLAFGITGAIPVASRIGVEAGILMSPFAGYTADTGAVAGESPSLLIFSFHGTYDITSSYSAFGGIRVSSAKASIGSSGEVQYSQVLFNGGIQFSF